MKQKPYCQHLTLISKGTRVPTGLNVLGQLVQIYRRYVKGIEDFQCANKDCRAGIRSKPFETIRIIK